MYWRLCGTADLKETAGVGHWDKDGTANCATWREHLLTVVEDKPTQRTHGWRRKLEQNSPSGTDSFERGLNKLKNFALTDVTRSLLHCDLMNRNALVDGGRINAVFDWGCGRFGDHLYDLAWFEFWAPWHTNLDVPLLREALENQWIQVGYVPTNLQERLSACYLHIGLDHIAYNAHTENWPVLQETAERMWTCQHVGFRIRSTQHRPWFATLTQLIITLPKKKTKQLSFAFNHNLTP